MRGCWRSVEEHFSGELDGLWGESLDLPGIRYQILILQQGREALSVELPNQYTNPAGAGHVGLR
jgi:hypothetical protein